MNVRGQEFLGDPFTVLRRMEGSMDIQYVNKLLLRCRGDSSEVFTKLVGDASGERNVTFRCTPPQPNSQPDSQPDSQPNS